MSADPRYCACGCGTQLHGRADQRFVDDSHRKRHARSQPIGVAHELRQLIGMLSAGPETLDAATFALSLDEQATVMRWARASGRSPVEAQVALLRRRFADATRLTRFGFTDAVLRAALTPAPAGACRWCLARASTLAGPPLTLSPHFLPLLDGPCLACVEALTTRKPAPRKPATPTRTVRRDERTRRQVRALNTGTLPPAGNFTHDPQQGCAVCAEGRRVVTGLPQLDAQGAALIAAARYPHVLIRAGS